MEADEKLQLLKATVLQGWPETDPKVAEYWTYRHEISICNGVLCKGEIVLVPTTLTESSCLAFIQVIKGSKHVFRQTRDALFWPCMSQQFRNLVTICSICADHAPAQVKEPLMTPELPMRPWGIIAPDLYTLDGKEFLIKFDA